MCEIRYRRPSGASCEDWESIPRANTYASCHGSTTNGPARYHEPAPPGQTFELEYCPKDRTRDHRGSTLGCSQQPVASVQTNPDFSPLITNITLPRLPSPRGDDPSGLRFSNPTTAIGSPAKADATRNASRRTRSASTGHGARHEGTGRGKCWYGRSPDRVLSIPLPEPH